MSDFFSSFIGFNGRLNRRAYIKRTLALWALAAVYGFMFSRLNVIMTERGLTELLLVLQAVFMVAFSIIFIMLMVRRFHDFGWSGWRVIGLFAGVIVLAAGVSPQMGQIANAIFQVAPFVIPGTAGANEYGPDGQGAPPAAESAQQEEDGQTEES